MEIRMPEKRLNEGENNARTLQITVDGACAGHEIRLAFLTPAGRRLLTPPIPLTDGSAQYELPACVLDAGGRLLAQIVAESDTLQITKSEVFGFDVDRSIPVDGAETDGATLITLGGLHNGLLELQAEVALCARRSELPTVPDRVSAFENDADYATRAYVLETVEAAEREAVPAHTHDDRYYTEAETDALLQEKVSGDDVTAAIGALQTNMEAALSGKASTQALLDVEEVVSGKADKSELPQTTGGAFTPSISGDMTATVQAMQIGDVGYVTGSVEFIGATIADLPNRKLGELGNVSAPYMKTYIPCQSFDGSSWHTGYLVIETTNEVYANCVSTDTLIIFNGYYLA